MRKAIGLIFLLGACTPKAPAPAAKPPPAVVAKEGELLTVTLTAEADARLGIKTAPVELKRAGRVRSVGGVALVPPGRAVTVGAPLAGSLGKDGVPAGSALSEGQTVLTLRPFLSAEARTTLAASRIEAEGALEGAKVHLGAAELALARAEQLLKDRAGSQRSVEEARAQRDAARAGLRAVETRRELLSSVLEGALGSLPIVAPLKGLLRALHVAGGEAVTAGTPLFEVADLSRLWLRVPVHAGEVSRIEAGREVRIEGLVARPVAAPPSADPATATVDLYYEVDNGAGILRPGQRVAVPLPLKTEAESLVVPWSAVLHDYQGGTWVYQRLRERTYARQRIEVAWVDGPSAVLARGPKPGTDVVTEGVAELFGTEFGHAR